MRYVWSLLLVLGPLAACSTETGVPVPAESAPPTTRQVTTVTPEQTPLPERPFHAPEVRSGPSVDKEWQRPCDLLDDQAATTIGIDGPSRVSSDQEVAASCVREAGEQRLEYVLHGRISAFSDPYLAPTAWRYFADAVVGGQPAGVFSEQAQPTGGCTVAVGLNPEASLTVELRTKRDPEVCGRALAVAEHLVSGFS